VRPPDNLVWRSSLTRRARHSLRTLFICVFAALPAAAQQIDSHGPQPERGSNLSTPELPRGNISGTVFDVNNDIVPGAAVTLEGPHQGDSRAVAANDKGAFEFDGVKPGASYHLTIRADGFVSWTSPTVIVNPGQFVFLSDCKLEISGGVSSVTVYSSSEQIAAEQVKIEEEQRVLGIIPNFYVVYGHNPAPLTKTLKFKLALKASTDPVIFLGATTLAAINQAADRPDYAQGTKGYGQRLGAAYANVFTNLMIGGAILPSLLHQDPRYFYQGTGTRRSRVLHAISSPFVCKGDNGKWQLNYSSIGGDLTTGAISNIYYPATSRGPELVFEGTLISTGGRMVNGLIQEFFLRRFTQSAKN